MKKYSLEELKNESVDKFECELRESDVREMQAQGFENAYALLEMFIKDFSKLGKEKLSVKEYLEWRCR